MFFDPLSTPCSLMFAISQNKKRYKKPPEVKTSARPLYLLSFLDNYTYNIRFVKYYSMLSM